MANVDGAEDFFNTFIGLLHGWDEPKTLNDFKMGQRSAADLIKLFLIRSGQESTYLKVTKLEDIYHDMEESNA